MSDVSNWADDYKAMAEKCVMGRALQRLREQQGPQEQKENDMDKTTYEYRKTYAVTEQPGPEWRLHSCLTETDTSGDYPVTFTVYVWERKTDPSYPWTLDASKTDKGK